MGRGEPHIGRAKLRSAEPVAKLQPDRHEQLDEHDSAAAAAASSAAATTLSDTESESSAVPASASMASAPIRGQRPIRSLASFRPTVSVCSRSSTSYVPVCLSASSSASSAATAELWSYSSLCLDSATLYAGSYSTASTSCPANLCCQLGKAIRCFKLYILHFFRLGDSSSHVLLYIFLFSFLIGFGFLWELRVLLLLLYCHSHLMSRFFTFILTMFYFYRFYIINKDFYCASI